MTAQQEFTVKYLDTLDACSKEVMRLVKNILLQYETKIDIQENPDDYFNPEHDISVTKSLIRFQTGKLKNEINGMQSTFEEIEKELNEI